jgi:hypothetical protein
MARNPSGVPKPGAFPVEPAERRLHWMREAQPTVTTIPFFYASGPRRRADGGEVKSQDVVRLSALTSSVESSAAHAAWSSGTSSLFSLILDFSGSARQKEIDSAER